MILTSGYLLYRKQRRRYQLTINQNITFEAKIYENLIIFYSRYVGISLPSYMCLVSWWRNYKYFFPYFLCV
jgi:hypothetical protein